MCRVAVLKRRTYLDGIDFGATDEGITSLELFTSAMVEELRVSQLYTASASTPMKMVGATLVSMVILIVSAQRERGLHASREIEFQALHSETIILLACSKRKFLRDAVKNDMKGLWIMIPSVIPKAQKTSL